MVQNLYFRTIRRANQSAVVKIKRNFTYMPPIGSRSDRIDNPDGIFPGDFQSLFALDAISDNDGSHHDSGGSRAGQW